MKKAIWIGPVVRPEAEHIFKAISPAANKWQNSLIQSLENSSIELMILSYLPEPYFPKGSLIPVVNKTYVKPSIIQNKFINLPLLRNYTLANALINSAKKFNNFQFVITYNNSVPHIKAAQFLRSKFKMKWINIVADDLHCKGPDATVYLSHGYFKSSNHLRKYHFDGGIDFISPINIGETQNKKKVFLFAGAINKWTGIEVFATDFSFIPPEITKDIELHIYGKGSSKILDDLVKKDDRIKWMGFVTKEQLDNAMISCYAFVNPRPINIIGGEFNFPSKLLTYLSFGKPILSTYTKGLAPYYEDVIFFYDGTRKSLSEKIIKMNQMDVNDHIDIQLKILKFVEENTWEKKVAGFLDFVDTL